MTVSRLDPEVEAVLTRKYLSFGPPLRAAWGWNRSSNKADLGKAEQLLERLTAPDQYAFALPVWYERAFNLVRQGRSAEALALLREVNDRFRHLMDEDTLSLWGRIFKDQGDVELQRGNLAAAEMEYEKAEDRYLAAYRLNRDRYPGINVACLRFVRAGLLKAMAVRPLRPGADATGLDVSTAGRGEAADYQAAAHELAAELVGAQNTWTDHLPDDAIWRLATLAEAYVLLGEWDAAAASYKSALAPENRPQPFHVETMTAQLKRILSAYEMLGDKPRRASDFIPS